MAETPYTKKISTNWSFTRIMGITLFLAVVVALGISCARVNTPSSGDSCSVRHATSQDKNGRTMWCDRATIGQHNLVWQYNGS